MKALDLLTAIRSAPPNIRANAEPEMFSKAIRAWCEDSMKGTLYIDLSSPFTLAERDVERLKRPAAGRANVMRGFSTRERTRGPDRLLATP